MKIDFYHRLMSEKLIFWLLMLIILIVLVITRFVHLDRDQADYNLTQLGTKDEQSYNFTAINLHHFGSVEKALSTEWKIKGSINTILNTFPVFLGLESLGNNYYGLRVPAAVASIFVCLAMLLWFHNSLGNANSIHKRVLIVILLLMLSFDFSFLASSRNAAPVIFRALYVSLTGVLLWKCHVNERVDRVWFFASTGLVSTLLVFFSYYTNIFLLLAVMIYSVISGWYSSNWKQFWLSVVAFSFGVLLGFVISEFVYFKVHGIGVFDSIRSTLVVYGNRLSVDTGLVSSSTHLSWMKPFTRSINNIRLLMSTTLFRYNGVILVSLIATVLYSVSQIWSKEQISGIRKASISIVTAFFLQAVVYNPHASKWISVIFPLMLILTLSTIHSLVIKPPFIPRVRSTVVFIVFISITLMFVLIEAFRQLESMELKLLSLISALLGASFTFVFLMWLHKPESARLTNAMMLVLMLSIIPPGILSISKLLAQPTYHYRDALLEINSIVGNATVAGGWTDGFRLYTNGKTLQTWYQNQNSHGEYKRRLTKIFDQGLAKYSVDYDERQYLDIFKDVETKNKDYRMIPVKSLFIGEVGGPDSVIVIQRASIDSAEGF